MKDSIKVLIIEDEPLAAAQLASLLTKLRPTFDILTVCDTIDAGVKWISDNEQPDLAFFDIHLGDGLSFEIISKTKFNAPIIFTTAYDQYAIQAFKVNSIDYLLKPLDETELEQALIKFENKPTNTDQAISRVQIQSFLQTINKQEFKKRFLVKIGNKLKSIKTDDIDYLYSFQKGTYIKVKNKDYLIDLTLEQVEQLLNPELFYRINRKYIVSINSITDVSIYSNSRLKLKVDHANEDDFFVAREKVKLFKIWLEGN